MRCPMTGSAKHSITRLAETWIASLRSQMTAPMGTGAIAPLPTLCTSCCGGCHDWSGAKADGPLQTHQVQADRPKLEGQPHSSERMKLRTVTQVRACQFPSASDRLPVPSWRFRHPPLPIPLSLRPDLSPQSDNRGLQETTTPWSSPRTGRGLSPELIMPPYPERASPAPQHRLAGCTTTIARR